MQELLQVLTYVTSKLGTLL